MEIAIIIGDFFILVENKYKDINFYMKISQTPQPEFIDQWTGSRYVRVRKEYNDILKINILFTNPIVPGRIDRTCPVTGNKIQNSEKDHPVWKADFT